MPSDEIAITIRCPRSDAPVVAALLMHGGTALATQGHPAMHALGEALSDEIIAAATGQDGIESYLAVPQLLAELDPADGDLLGRFEVDVDG